MKAASKCMFFVPFLYALHTRMGNGIIALLKWLSEYVIPTFLVTLLVANGSFAVWFDFALMLVLTYTLYEVGYMYNDAYTIKREQHPTLRLNEQELVFFYKYEWLIISFRLLLSGLLSVFILWKYEYSSIACMTVVAAWCILFVYAIFNSVRSHVSFLLHTLLLLLRYSVPWLLFSHDSLPVILAFVFFLYPLPNMMENIARNKYGINYAFTRIYLSHYDRRYLFRVRYYLVVVTATMILLFFGLIPFGYLLLAAYFFVYECFFYVLFGKKRSV